MILCSAVVALLHKLKLFFFADDQIIIAESLPHLRTDTFRMPHVIMKCQPAGRRNSGRPLTILLHYNTETGKGHETCP